MINPELHPFLDDWAKAWSSAPHNSSPQQIRDHFKKIAADMRLPTPKGITTDVQFVPFGDRQVRIRLFRRAGAIGSVPALVYMHGGGWMQGDPETHWDITARIAADTGVLVISVDYALAPDQKFPVAVNECITVTRWVCQNADELGVDGRCLFVGGDSAGANLAAAATLALRGSDVVLSGQLLIYPPVDHTLEWPSLIENADGPIVSTKEMGAVRDMYCRSPEDWNDPLVAPLHAKNHADLPPAFIAVAEHDPLRDQGIAYAQALESAGVTVTLDHGKGLIHGYLRAQAYCADSRAKLSAMCNWLMGQTQIQQNRCTT